MAAVGEYRGSEPHRLTQEEREKQIARLTAPPRPVEVRDPFPVCPTTKLPQAEIDQMTDRLYNQSIKQREADQAELAKRYGAADATGTAAAGAGVGAPGAAVTLSEEEKQKSIDRLYTQSIEQKKRNLEEAKKRCEAEENAKKKRMPLNDFVQRMYYDRLEAQRKTEEKLYEKYITATELHMGTITPAQMAESADRLSSSKK